MPRGKSLKNPNGYGSVVKLSGKRRNPFEVRVNIRTDDFRSVLGQTDKAGKPLSHAMQEHIKNLFTQMDKFALQNDVIEKGYASFAAITVAEDDTPGIPFTLKEIQTLWDNKDVPWVDSILIYIYSGWRVSELIQMPVDDIDLKEGTFRRGLKTAAGKNRLVPIHSKIRGFVARRLISHPEALFSINGKTITSVTYTKLFKKTLKAIGIDTYHTPHDCRHTFTSLLDSAGVNQVCIDRLIGHASSSLTTRIYTHKTIEDMTYLLVKSSVALNFTWTGTRSTGF